MMTPDLTDRQAVCAYANGKKPGRYLRPGMHDPVSSDAKKLAFFEYRGPGSDFAKNRCTECTYNRNVHTDQPDHGESWAGKHGRGVSDHAFVVRGPAEYDSYYCGCWGWD